jgi:SAM-dependent methyltransferase
MPDPALWRARWMGRFREYVGATERRVAELRLEADGPSLLTITRSRVTRVVDAIERQRVAVSERFARLGEPGEQAQLNVALSALSSGEPPETLLKCYEHLFRDWCWGQAENDQALSLVASALAQRESGVAASLGRLAVYGAGAGRLAVDVHQRFASDRTFAVDVNPLPLLVAQELLRGGEAELPEFPVGPHSDDGFVQAQRLRGPGELRPGFQLVFADAFSPPFAVGSLDTLLTPWFIDAVEPELPHTLAALSRVLRPGGYWVNFGPLRFDGRMASRYMLEDVLELAEQAGFERPVPIKADVSYFDAPHSGSRRIETVFAFAVRKLKNAPELGEAAVPHGPSWVRDPNLNIPLGEELGNLKRATVFHAGVLSMIDGSRSIRDIAATLGQQWRQNPEQLVPTLQALLERLATRAR